VVFNTVIGARAGIVGGWFLPAWIPIDCTVAYNLVRGRAHVQRQPRSSKNITFHGNLQHGHLLGGAAVVMIGGSRASCMKVGGGCLSPSAPRAARPSRERRAWRERSHSVGGATARGKAAPLRR
jgi:hypothetical protein